MSLARRIFVGAIGVASGGAVVAAVLAVHWRWFGGWPVAPEWINALAAGVAGVALVVSWLERAPGRRRLPCPVAIALGAALGTMSLAVYVGLGDVQFPYHRWDQFHYYLGAKYLPELGYMRLYECTAVAEAERFGRSAVAARTIRDLGTEALVPAARALADPESCTRHFSPARWAAFGDDVAWFRRDMPAPWYWRRMQGDHGYNGAPTWSIAGRALASLGPASARMQTALALIDPVLLAVAFGLIGWAFGAHAVWVALVVWGCQFPAKGAWTTGAFLRQDWLLAVIASVCLARRERWVGAGIALATAAMLRLFPALLLGVPLLVAVRRWLVTRTLAASHRRFVLGLVIGAAVWLSAATAVFGIATSREFIDRIALHASEPLANHVGLRAVLSQTMAGRLAKTEDDGAVDPFHVWKVRREEAFAARRPIYLLLVGGVVALAAVAAGRIHELWIALAGSTVLVVALVDVASYYCAFFVLLALLGSRDPRHEWLALGAIVVSRLVNALPLVADSVDVRYAAQSVVFVGWATLALAMLVWRPSAAVTPST
jgi:hypothetical protein